jgi:hypothetical protein
MPLGGTEPLTCIDAIMSDNLHFSAVAVWTIVPRTVPFRAMLGSKKFHLCRVLHGLSVNSKRKRVSYLRLLPTALMEDKPADFERAVTRDKLWFFMHPPHDSLWAESLDDLPHRMKHKINIKSA